MRARTLAHGRRRVWSRTVLAVVVAVIVRDHRGAESERRWQHRELIGADVAQ